MRAICEKRIKRKIGTVADEKKFVEFMLQTLENNHMELYFNEIC